MENENTQASKVPDIFVKNTLCSEYMNIWLQYIYISLFINSRCLYICIYERARWTPLLSY